MYKLCKQCKTYKLVRNLIWKGRECSLETLKRTSMEVPGSCLVGGAPKIFHPYKSTNSKTTCYLSVMSYFPQLDILKCTSKDPAVDLLSEGPKLLLFIPALSHHQPRIRSTFYIACIGRKQIITNKNILIEVSAASFIHSCTAGQRTFKYSVCIHKVSSWNQSQNNDLPITRKAAILSHLRHVLSHIVKMWQTQAIGNWDSSKYCLFKNTLK